LALLPSSAQIEDSGQHEQLNWFCLISAMAELGRRPDYAAFVETNIMNSNKVIAVYRPVTAGRQGSAGLEISGGSDGGGIGAVVLNVLFVGS
jgi:hypothetical protein